jgi:hypothetical protein
MFHNPTLKKLIIRQAVLIVALAGMWHASSLAGEPQPWGVHILWPAEAAFEASAQERPAPLTVQRRLDTTAKQIQKLETVLGPYSPELTDPLANAAREAKEYGANEVSLELYRWALHSTRINSGLSSADQLPLLEEILELLREQGDPVEVGRQINYFYRLLGRGAEPWSPQRLNASIRWLSEQSELLASSPWQGKESDVLFVVSHGKDMARAICDSAQWQRPWCKLLSLEVLKLYYLIDWNVDPLVVDSFGASQDRYVNPYQQGLQQNREQSPGEYRLRTIESTIGSTARGLIERALEVFPQDETLLHAKADWLMHGGRQAQALQIYQMLQQQGSFDFTKPGPLPEVPTLTRDHRISREWAPLKIIGEVTPRGNLRNVVVSAPDPAGDSLLGFARRQLRSIRFRPALTSEGEPIEAPVDWSVKVLR